MTCTLCHIGNQIISTMIMLQFEDISIFVDIIVQSHPGSLLYAHVSSLALFYYIVCAIPTLCFRFRFSRYSLYILSYSPYSPCSPCNLFIFSLYSPVISPCCPIYILILSGDRASIRTELTPEPQRGQPNCNEPRHGR